VLSLQIKIKTNVEIRLIQFFGEKVYPMGINKGINFRVIKKLVVWSSFPLVITD
jgi:hypothetical protein